MVEAIGSANAARPASAIRPKHLATITASSSVTKLGEMVGDGPCVGSFELGEDPLPFVGHRRNDAATILRAGRAAHDQAALLQLHHPPGQPAATEQGLLGQIAHPQPLSGRQPQFDQYVVPLQGHAAVALQLPIHQADQDTVRFQGRVPG